MREGAELEVDVVIVVVVVCGDRRVTEFERYIQIQEEGEIARLPS